MKKHIVPTLDATERVLIRKRYGDDLDNPIADEEFSAENAKQFYGSLIPKLKRRLIKAGVIDDGKDKKENALGEDAPKRRRSRRKATVLTVSEEPENVELRNIASTDAVSNLSAEGADSGVVLEENVETVPVAVEGSEEGATFNVTALEDSSPETLVLEDDDNTAFQLLEEVSDVSETDFDEFIEALAKECEEIEARIGVKLQKLDVSITLSDRKARLLEREAQLDREIAARLTDAKKEGKGVTKVYEQGRNN